MGDRLLDKKKLASIIAAAIPIITQPPIPPPILSVAPQVMLSLLNKEGVLLNVRHLDPVLEALEWERQSSFTTTPDRKPPHPRQSGRRITSE